MEVNVAICCQVQLYAEGMCKLLEEDDEIHVVGISVGNGGVERLLDMDPDIIVTDTGNCKKVISLLTNGESKNVLMIGDKGKFFDSSDLKLMITDGLRGLLPKESDGNVLRKAVKKLNEGEIWIDNQTLKEVLSGKVEEKSNVHLTKKEAQILESICDGLTNKEIAKKMFISEQTVKSHCNHLFKKFGVSSRLKLAVRAPKYVTKTAHLQ